MSPVVVVMTNVPPFRTRLEATAQGDGWIGSRQARGVDGRGRDEGEFDDHESRAN
jgi:hypothetical protein